MREPIRIIKDNRLRNLPLQGFNRRRMWCALAALTADLTAWPQLFAFTHEHPALRLSRPHEAGYGCCRYLPASTSGRRGHRILLRIKTYVTGSDLVVTARAGPSNPDSPTCPWRHAQFDRSSAPRQCKVTPTRARHRGLVKQIGRNQVPNSRSPEVRRQPKDQYQIKVSGGRTAVIGVSVSAQTAKAISGVRRPENRPRRAPPLLSASLVEP